PVSTEHNETGSEDNSEEFDDNEVDVTKRYPTIDFNELPTRIRGLKDVLLKIVNNEDLGYYRKLAEDTIKVV
ncbi:14488_t:CDS:2, partial [Racocetra fulgida]